MLGLQMKDLDSRDGRGVRRDSSLKEAQYDPLGVSIFSNRENAAASGERHRLGTARGAQLPQQ